MISAAFNQKSVNITPINRCSVFVSNPFFNQKFSFVLVSVPLLVREKAEAILVSDTGEVLDALT